MQRRRWLGAAVLLLLAVCVFWHLTQTPPKGASGAPAERYGPTAASTHSPGAHAPLPVRTESPPARLQLAGEVQTTDGAPVAGVQVAFISHARLEAADAADLEPEAIVRTDAQGRFSLQVSDAGYLTVLEGATPRFAVVETSRSDLLFRRNASCALDVTVVDWEGRPRAEYIFSFSYTKPTSSSAVVSMETGGPFQSDAHGRARLAHAPCGTLQFMSGASSQEPLAATLVDTLLEQSVTLRLGASVGVHGVVLDPTGSPVADASLWIRWGGSNVNLSADGAGRFEVEVPPEEDILFNVFTSDHGSHEERHRSPTVRDDPWGLELRMPAVRAITARCPDDGTECRSQDAPTCVWEGEHAGRPMQQTCRVTEDAHEYTCMCGPDSSELRANHRFESVQVAPGVEAVQLVGHASPLDGLERVPVQGTAVLLSEEQPCTVQFRHIDDPPGRVMGVGTCSPQGQLQLDLPVGEPLWVEVEQGGRSRTVQAMLEDASSTLETISLRGSASLTVTIVGSTDEFVSSGTVMLMSDPSDSTGVAQIAMFSSASGAHFAALPAGSYTVSGFIHPSRAAGQQTVTLASGEGLEVELHSR